MAGVRGQRMPASWYRPFGLAVMISSLFDGQGTPLGSFKPRRENSEAENVDRQTNRPFPGRNGVNESSAVKQIF